MKLLDRSVVAVCACFLLGVLCVGLWNAASSVLYELRPAPSEPPVVQSSGSRLSEPEYTQIIARQRGWSAEVVTRIGTRCDLVSETHCIEVEWPGKCYEAVGQAGSYSVLLGKPPAVLFLLSDGEQSEREFVLARVGELCRRWNVEIIWYNTITQHVAPSWK